MSESLLAQFDREPVELINVERGWRVGSVQNFSEHMIHSNLTYAHRYEWVATVGTWSYGNDRVTGDKAKRLFDMFVERGHLSVLEFVPVGAGRFGESDDWMGMTLRHNPKAWTEVESDPKTGVDGINRRFWACFRIECPIFVARQIMRHRQFSYLELSRRYVNHKKQPFEFYGAPTGSLAAQMWIETYNDMVGAGTKPELARAFLPQATMTSFFVAGAIDGWRNFLKLRADDDHTQLETRLIAQQIKKALIEEQGWEL